jgi:hypothetical protein
MNLLVLFTTGEEAALLRKYAWVRISSVSDHFTNIERVCVFSYLRHHHKKLGLDFDIPLKYLRYACLAGSSH